MSRIQIVDLDSSWHYQHSIHDNSGPHGLEISPDGTRLYASKIACNRISVFDPRMLEPAHLFGIALDGEPMGMSMSADESRLFVSQVDPDGALGNGREFLEEEGYHATPDCPPLVPPFGIREFTSSDPLPSGAFGTLGPLAGARAIDAFTNDSLADLRTGPVNAAQFFVFVDQPQWILLEDGLTIARRRVGIPVGPITIATSRNGEPD